MPSLTGLVFPVHILSWSTVCFNLGTHNDAYLWASASVNYCCGGVIASSKHPSCYVKTIPAGGVKGIYSSSPSIHIAWPFSLSQFMLAYELHERYYWLLMVYPLLYFQLSLSTRRRLNADPVLGFPTMPPGTCVHHPWRLTQAAHHDRTSITCKSG